MIKFRPHKIKIGKKSWARVEPLQKGRRIEIHLAPDEDAEVLKAKVMKLLDELSI